MSYDSYDLWAPGARNEFKNRMFTGYVAHSFHIEEVIDKAVNAYLNGEEKIDISDPSFSDSDYTYIAEEVERRIRYKIFDFK